ncbi:NifB/NifX family molybdenum-iron cluster-binding protein [bacterium]|nr:NifB/NifX family molybdenum-iron cluster-binding protein [bacterium]
MALLAISATQPSLDAPVDPRFGRCAYFIFYDTETKKFESEPNPGVNLFRGAGVQAAQFVAQKGAQVVISGNFGPNAFLSLQQAGLKLYQFSGTVKQAIEAYQKGELQEFSQPPPGPGFGWGRGRGPGGRGGGQGFGRRNWPSV